VPTRTSNEPAGQRPSFWLPVAPEIEKPVATTMVVVTVTAATMMATTCRGITN
jgi:hypothetical protein